MGLEEVIVAWTVIGEEHPVGEHSIAFVSISEKTLILVLSAVAVLGQKEGNGNLHMVLRC